MNLKHPCRRTCSGYTQAIKEAEPVELLKNKHVRELLLALDYSLKHDMDLLEHRKIVLKALEPWEKDDE